MRCKKICGLLLLLAACYNSSASHLRAGEIQANRIDCNTLTFQITLLIYIDFINSNVPVGGDEDDFVYFGDGTSILVPEIVEYEVIDAALGVGLVKYTTLHTYNTFGIFKISYNEPNRNSGILNFAGSANTRFNIEASILIEPGICNSSPVLIISPIDRACSGISFFHNPGAFDPDLDSLSFELAVPKQKEGAVVTDYHFPNDEAFYTPAGIPYNNANETENGTPVFNIDAANGILTWDAPGMIGEYTIAIKIIEWKFRKTDSTRYEAGYLIRDMQIIVEDCNNRKPELKISKDLCVTAGSLIDFTSPATDPDDDSVFIEVFSDAFALTENPPVISPPNGILQSTQPGNAAAIDFKWQTSCSHVRELPYQIVFKISDRPSEGPRLIRFYTMNIKIIAPAPEYEKVSINPVSKNVTLEWKDHPCENIRSFQVWRRISRYDYDQPECNNGMPYFLHYQLLAQLPPHMDSYTDSNLDYGSQYCYRIVALVGEKSTPGRISLDTCFIPKPAEAPVIVNVSVQNTDDQMGEILIRWTTPFDIDQQQYPPPYFYKVFRKNQSDPHAPFQLITSANISDTLFTDTGINTRENIYRYRIELYVPVLTGSPVDTSSAASSVFIHTQPVSGGIALTWQANTPWYNYSQSHPYHLVYRSNSPTGTFTLIDSVEVNENDFRYVDEGQYNNIDLTGDLYYYKVKTRGTYGNPGILSPLENFSQITSGHVSDTIPPCQPFLTIADTDCQAFSCDGSDYYTKLEWKISDSSCDTDVVAYEVLVAQDNPQVYTSLGIVTGNVFVHDNINSLNKCYRLISIDWAGNRSDTSAVVCNSNCVRFKLPNVITPGVKDERNDFLTTYPSGNNSRQDCSRSVRQVDLKIFTRWGKEIFTTSSIGPETPVFWNGFNQAGREVSAGTYFYEAIVVFDTNDPSEKVRHLKGWVHVLR